MATRFTGGCICGGVRYKCAADPNRGGELPSHARKSMQEKDR